MNIISFSHGCYRIKQAKPKTLNIDLSINEELINSGSNHTYFFRRTINPFKLPLIPKSQIQSICF